MKSDNFQLEEIIFEAPSGESTPAPQVQNPAQTTPFGEVVWPYIAFSIVLLLGLIGIALKILRNQKK